MNFLLTGIIAAVTACLSLLGAYNYLPLSFFEESPRLGSSITTIASTDTLRDSRTTINDNFTALNNGKIENSTTSVAAITTLSNLVTVGTITSGTWTGTGIDVARQGTGTTSPSSNQVILGNGSSGFKTVTGWGTTNYVLTSNGGVAAPTWQLAQSDQSLNYLWTGSHRFGAGATTTSLVASSTSANPLILNTVSYNTPSSQGASTTSMVNDGSGNLKWIRPDWVKLCEETISTTSATSTCSWTGSAVDIEIRHEIAGASGNVNPRVMFNYDYNSTSTHYAARSFQNYAALGVAPATNYLTINNSGTTTATSVKILLTNTTSNPKQGTYITISSSTLPTLFSGSVLWSNTTQQINRVDVVVSDITQTWSAGTRLEVWGKGY